MKEVSMEYEKIELIKDLTIKGVSTKEIAEQFDLSESRIRDIRSKYNIKRYCRICGEELSNRQRFYCEKCGKKHRAEKNKVKVLKRYHKFRSPNKIYEKICPICGLIFSTINPKKKYCSTGCHLVAKEIYYKTQWLPKQRKTFNVIPEKIKGLNILDENGNLEEGTLTNSEFSTHGDLFSLDHRLGTSSLGSKPDGDKEIEAKKVTKEYNRIFGVHKKLDKDLFSDEDGDKEYN